MFKLFRSWLGRIPVNNPVDRSNAYFLQFYFAFQGALQLLNKTIIVWQLGWARAFAGYHHIVPWKNLPIIIDLGTDVAMVISAWLGVYLVRKGAFHQAIVQYLSVVLFSGALFFASTGIGDTRNDSTFFELLIIGGLMLGRRALWVVFASTIFIYVVGVLVETFSPFNVKHTLSDAVSELTQTIYTYLVVTVLIDFSAHAFRQSLARAHSNHQLLQQEIVEREHVQEQLMHSRKMDAIGQLASGIAHDLNNVLGIVLGFARTRSRIYEMGMHFGKDAMLLVEALEGTELAARRGAAICRKLLNFSRRDSARAETFDMIEVVCELRPMLTQLLPAEIVLNIDSPDEEIAIHFDRNQFELAMLNLVGNARDAMPAGGICTISISRCSPALVMLTIRDTGAGIAEENISHVFEPFFTTKPPGSGTGLGLSVVYNLVKNAGGEIGIENLPGAGAAFHICLPIADELAKSVPMVPTEKLVRVLLIDDDDDLRGLLCDALESQGCLVTTAANGAETERKLASLKDMPEVLICDHRMPDTDGQTLLRKLRLRLPNTPAILISAYLDTDAQPASEQPRFTERLPKPFAPEALIARVHAAALRYRASS